MNKIEALAKRVVIDNLLKRNKQGKIKFKVSIELKMYHDIFECNKKLGYNMFSGG